ncbi:MAG: hypothetical protein ACKOPO_01030 [Novosphingobium sp.]
MIEARLETRLEGFANRLAHKAAALVEAKAETARLKAGADASRWRRAALLWPLFTKG